MRTVAARQGTNYVALAGEFFVLGELALRGFDGTLTLGHTKEVDILVLNRRQRRTFKVEVKTTGRGVRRAKIFGQNYAWLMHERAAKLRDRDLIYVFVYLDRQKDSKRVKELGYESAIVAEAYVCVGKVCGPPLKQPEQIRESVKSLLKTASAPVTTQS